MAAIKSTDERTQRGIGWLYEIQSKRESKNATSAALMSFTQPIGNATAAFKPILVGDFEINPSPDWAGAAATRQDEPFHEQRGVRRRESLYEGLTRANRPPDNTAKHREKSWLRLFELTEQIRL